MTAFSRIASEVRKDISTLARVATADRDAEWQRVNSYIADVLKDAHVLYAKLARLQGDFAGQELDGLEKISEDVLDIGSKLSSFSKAFYEGKVSMAEEESFGEGDDGPMFGGSEPPEEPKEESPKGEPESSKDSDKEEPEGEVDIDFDFGDSDELYLLYTKA